MSEKEETYCFKYDGRDYDECHALEAILTDAFCVQIEQVLVERHDLHDILNRTDQSSAIVPEGTVLIRNKEEKWYEIDVNRGMVIRPLKTPITWIRTVVEVLNEPD